MRRHLPISLKAQELGVPVLDEAGLRALLGQEEW